MPDRYTPEQRRAYMAQYRAERRAWALNELGGKCAVCGATEDLQYDHIDPATKVKPVTRMLHASRAAFEAEVRKCQLLCEHHHKKKSRGEQAAGPINHGTTWGYHRGCRCEPCRDARRRSRKRKPMDGAGVPLEKGSG